MLISGKIINNLEQARAEFARLIGLTQGKEKNELTDLLKDRVSKYVGNTYKVFEDKPILGIFNRYRPGDEAIGNAINDALKHIGVELRETPFRQRRVREAIQSAMVEKEGEAK